MGDPVGLQRAALKKLNLLDNKCKSINFYMKHRPTTILFYFYMKHRTTTVLFCTHKLQGGVRGKTWNLLVLLFKFI